MILMEKLRFIQVILNVFWNSCKENNNWGNHLTHAGMEQQNKTDNDRGK
jgi:hypothetical protein